MLDVPPLDLVVGLVAVLVAAWFFVAWRRIEEPALLLFAVGLGLKGVGYALGTSSEFAPTHRPATALEFARLAVIFAGNAIMVTAYLGGHGRRRWLGLGVVVAVAAVALAILDLFVPPLGSVDFLTLSTSLHAAVAVANVGCAVLAAQGFRESPRAGRALVPAAFLFWGLSNYTWLLIDLGSPSDFGAWVQAWRLVAVLLMLAALVWPRPREVRPPATA